MTDLLTTRSAVFNLDGDKRTHRYRLSRSFGTGGPHAAFCMVNPSIADAETDDPTIRKVMGFARRHGWGQISVVNKFAVIATDVRELRDMSITQAVGEYNDDHLFEVFRLADVIVAAWGPLAKVPFAMRNRWRMVDEIAASHGKPLHCFGTVQDGHPRHPLMTAYATPLTEWRAPQP